MRSRCQFHGRVLTGSRIFQASWTKSYKLRVARLTFSSKWEELPRFSTIGTGHKSSATGIDEEILGVEWDCGAFMSDFFLHLDAMPTHSNRYRSHAMCAKD